MDCQTFDSSLLDAIFDEIDASTSTAMDEHASDCPSCAANIARLRKTRSLVHPALEVAVPDGLEARILAAATAAMDAGEASVAHAVTGANAAPNNVTSLRDRRGLVAVLSRPQFAIAAAFVLVLGATAIFMQTSAKMEAPMAASHPSPGKASDEQRGAPPAPVAAAPVVAATATASASAIALAEPASPTPAPRALAADGKGLATAKTKGADPAFDSARALYDSGHYAEALPKFEALAAHSAEAELYVARCLAQTTGCAAADPHFDSAARRSDAESASHARLEAARCYKNAGHATAARSRYNSLTGDRYVAQEANRELAEITPKASGRAGPGAPAATATAKPPMAKPAIKTDAY